MSDRYFPPAAFSFVFGFTIKSFTDSDSEFQEVGGISVTQETSEIKEGGQNRFVHTVPGRTKFENLTLKRGLLLWDSLLADWCWQQFDSGLRTQIIPMDVTLALIDRNTADDGDTSKFRTLMTWNFVQAYPIKWSLGDLDATKSSFAVESLVLTYQYYTISKESKSTYLKKSKQ